MVERLGGGAGRDPTSITPASWLFVVTGRSRDEVDDALNSTAAKVFALNIPGRIWATHGVQHPLGHDFSGAQDLVPQTLDEQAVLSYTERVPVSLVKEAFLTGTPNDVVDQPARVARSRAALSGRLQPQRVAAQAAASTGHPYLGHSMST